MRTEADRRSAPRRTAFGKPIVPITATDREALTACVWDISRTGACLIFPARVHVPATFKIEFNNMPRQAQVMWRRNFFVGVHFTDAIPEFRLEIRSMLKPFLRSGEIGAGKPNLEFFGIRENASRAGCFLRCNVAAVRSLAWDRKGSFRHPITEGRRPGSRGDLWVEQVEPVRLVIKYDRQRRSGD